MKRTNFVKKIINFDVKVKKNRLRRGPSSGISLGGGQSPTARCAVKLFKGSDPSEYEMTDK